MYLVNDRLGTTELEPSPEQSPRSQGPYQLRKFYNGAGSALVVKVEVFFHFHGYSVTAEICQHICSKWNSSRMNYRKETK